MSKKVKVLVLMLVAVLLLTMSGAATVLAQEEPTQQDGPVQEERAGFLERVAELLGMTEEELTDIFKQAQQDMRNEAFISYVEKAVAEGLITSGEAEEIIDWWEARPEAVDKLFPRARIMRTIGDQREMPFPGKGIGWECLSENVTSQLRMRLENKFEGQNRPMPRARISQAIRGRQMKALPQGWQQQAPPESAD